MKDRDKTAAVIDGLLKFVVGGGTIATILVAPNLAPLLGRTTTAYFNKLDKRQQRRELKRILYYMKQKGLISVRSEDYEHGLTITKKGQARLAAADFDALTIGRPKKWDQRWRLVFFDIPESYRSGRRQLIHKLKQLGFLQLQRSVWVYPYPCRPEIELVTSTYDVQRYVSYIEADTIDSEHLLRKKFETILRV